MNRRIDVYHHLVPNAEMAHAMRSLGIIRTELRQIMTTAQEIKDGLAAALAATTANTNTLDSALTFIQGINTNVTALQQQVADLQAQIANGGTVSQADLDDIGAGLTSLTEATAAQTAKEAILTNAVDGDPNT